MPIPPAWVLAFLAGLAVPGATLAAGERPTGADIAACREFARSQPDIPAYMETAPANPFPARVSHVAPWTGPVVPTREPLPAERSLVPGPVEVPQLSGEFGAGGSSLEATSEPGPLDPRFQGAFDACMRARGF